MEKQELVIWFKDIGKEDIPIVGGKCANLGELIGKVGVPVPDGFAVSAYAYRVFLEKTKAKERIEALLSDIDTSDMEMLHNVSEKIRKYIEGLPMPKEIEKDVLKKYKELCKKAGNEALPVAVRSSATAEDLPGASFAGQQDTFLNVTEKSLLTSIKKCWSSLFTPRAIVYRKEKGFSDDEVLISVAVQQLIFSKASGVMFTIEPVSGSRDKVIINAAWGLGEAVVSGQVTPDEYVVEKETFRILEKDVVKKDRQIVSDKKGGTKWVEVPHNLQKRSTLTDGEIVAISKYGIQIENHYGVPQDIEWAIDDRGKIFLLQARPETVFGKEKEMKTDERKDTMEKDMLIKGIGVSPGQASGKVKIILNVKDISRFQPGEISGY